MSITGVPSIASRPRTVSQRSSWTSRTSTRCSPIGFGRSAERVANTPVSGLPGVVPGMNLEHFPVGLVEPGEENDFVAGLDRVERLDEGREDLDPRVGGALMTLLGSLRRVLEAAVDAPDRNHLGGSAGIHLERS